MQLRLWILPSGASLDKTDYTDYLEQFSFQCRSDNILQATIPRPTLVVTLSTRLPDNIKVGSSWVQLGYDRNHVEYRLAKITRGKGKTELQCSALPSDLFDTLLKGRLLVGAYSSFVTMYDFEAESKYFNNSAQVYCTEDDHYLLGVAATAKEPMIIAPGLPAPYAKNEYSSLPRNLARRLQTLAEFDKAPAKYVQKIEIDYNDVIEEEEVTSTVVPTAILSSRLEQVNKGRQITYTSTTSWTNVLDEIRLFDSSDGSIYAVGIVQGTGASQTTKLYLADGTLLTKNGAVTAVAQDWYAVCQYVSSSSYTTVVRSMIDDSVIYSTSTSAQVGGASFKVLGAQFAVHGHAVKLRSTLVYSHLPSDLAFFGKPTAIGGTYYTGIASYENQDGTKTTKLLTTTYSLSSTAYLIGAYVTNSTGVFEAVYGDSNGSITILKYTREGNYTTASKPNIVNGTGVTPMSAAMSVSQGTLVYGMDDGGQYMRYANGTWYRQAIGIIQSVQCAGDYNKVVVAQYNHFAWRQDVGLTEIASSDVQPRSSRMIAVLAAHASLLVFGEGATNEERYLVLEASAIPENTNTLSTKKYETGNSGEDYEIRLPFVLQGVNRAWPLIPTNSTRLRVQVAAINAVENRSNSIQLNAGTAYADGYIYYTYGTNYKPGHKYYIGLDVKAPQGMTATKASFSWTSDSFGDTPYARLVRLDLSNIAPTGDAYVRKGALVTVPSDYSTRDEVARDPGVYIEGANNALSFKTPMIIDLTDTYGEGNEPTLEWCNENLTGNVGNILSSYSLDSNATSYKWYVSNGSFLTGMVSERCPVNNDTMTIPPIGCPVLYHREPDGSDDVEAICLGFEWNFNGNSELYLDLMTLPDPQPWGTGA